MTVTLLYPKSSLGSLLNRVFVAQPAQIINRTKRIHILIGITAIVLLPISGQLVLMAGSFEILALYITHTAFYADFLLVGATIAITTKVNFIRGYIRSLYSKLAAIRGSRAKSN